MKAKMGDDLLLFKLNKHDTFFETTAQNLRGSVIKADYYFASFGLNASMKLGKRNRWQLPHALRSTHAVDILRKMLYIEYCVHFCHVFEVKL